MTHGLKECEVMALRLPAKERAALAQQLIASLDALDDADNESLWLDEAEKSYQEFKSGKIPSRSADKILREARSAIQ